VRLSTRQSPFRPYFFFHRSKVFVVICYAHLDVSSFIGTHPPLIPFLPFFLPSLMVIPYHTFIILMTKRQVEEQAGGVGRRRVMVLVCCRI
jgi:hypothetical protein